MLCPQGAPTAADNATATTTTSATDRPSPNQIRPKWTKPGHHNRTHCDTLSAIVTSRGPQNVETYVGPLYEEITVTKYTIIPYKTLQKMDSGPPSGPPSKPSSSWPPTDLYYVLDTANTSIAALTTTAWTNLNAILTADPTNVSGNNINSSVLEEIIARICQEEFALLRQEIRQEREESWGPQ